MVVPHSMAGHWSLLRQSLSSEPEPKSYRTYQLYIFNYKNHIVCDLGFDAKGFSAVVDVHLFEPNDISVKTIDHTIVVECNHESREDGHGPVERHFRRKFHLPMEYDMSLVTSTLSKDGILQLHASKPHFIGEEREVQVHHTEKPSLIMSLLSNRANSMLRRSHSIPSDNEED